MKKQTACYLLAGVALIVLLTASVIRLVDHDSSITIQQASRSSLSGSILAVAISVDAERTACVNDTSLVTFADQSGRTTRTVQLVFPGTSGSIGNSSCQFMPDGRLVVTHGAANILAVISPDEKDNVTYIDRRAVDGPRAEERLLKLFERSWNELSAQDIPTDNGVDRSAFTEHFATRKEAGLRSGLDVDLKLFENGQASQAAGRYDAYIDLAFAQKFNELIYSDDGFLKAREGEEAEFALADDVGQGQLLGTADLRAKQSLLVIREDNSSISFYSVRERRFVYFEDFTRYLPIMQAIHPTNVTRDQPMLTAREIREEHSPFAGCGFSRADGKMYFSCYGRGGRYYDSRDRDWFVLRVHDGSGPGVWRGLETSMVRAFASDLGMVSVLHVDGTWKIWNLLSEPAELLASTKMELLDSSSVQLQAQCGIVALGVDDRLLVYVDGVFAEPQAVNGAITSLAVSPDQVIYGTAAGDVGVFKVVWPG
jgi:hypothetical protein